jgi:histidinol-phosphatase (PHP family)
MPLSNESAPWKVSLHGGHSGEFCDHADDTLRELLEAAVAFGYHTFGVSEHAPRGAERFLYDEEQKRGWDVAKTEADFVRYQTALQTLAAEFADRLIVLRGFEIEVVPQDSYVSRMQAYRAATLPDGSPVFDYCVGSVHYVNEQQIDGPVENYLKAIEVFGSLEALAVRYYETIAEMVEALRPDVVGHFDLMKRNLRLGGYTPDDLETPRIHAAAENALEAVHAHGAILDLNTAGWRKGLGEPYPAPPFLQRAHEMGIGFCFGDDSHRIREVGAGVIEAREYLLQNGVPTVTVLTREDGTVVRRTVPL